MLAGRRGKSTYGVLTNERHPGELEDEAQLKSARAT
jgi:hypothetical protein